MGDVQLSGKDLAWLSELMSVPSVSPLEGGDPREVVGAQQCFLTGAVERGLRKHRWDSPPATDLELPGVPAQVRAAAAVDPKRFLATQPSVVVGIGRRQPPHRRLVINFHIDTVSPHIPPKTVGRTLYGRGAVDDKGPGVAAVVGVAAAFSSDPLLADDLEVQVASVPGEEGGAMGVYGTRWLVRSGCVGRLMLFAEPTGCRSLDACSAAMTPMLVVQGMDSTDDRPEQGHNATLALGFLATRLMEDLSPLAQHHGAKLCLSGVHTGRFHNRVYGTGELKLNIAYYDQDAASKLAEAVHQVVAGVGKEFVHRFGNHPVARRLATDWADVVRLEWLKRDLPPLSNRDHEMESLLYAVGLPRHDGTADGSAFTCDAIWASGPGRYVIVCGPGQLDSNGAHTPREHVPLDDLDEYATRIRDLVLGFADHVRGANSNDNSDQLQDTT
ncbi:hypothetical protein GCM10012275_59010 [Longimycelium tulufanense]|uniref:Acetylornithine deacetylase n=1 Tax=Longimycelium tulufanense TaxID=907463 RepID=A0A8J3CKC3_9PSEU|nr:M20/M25/M40 family metallo-hydrolase [Longimycelium tulufanense]GGM80561.1 hypothetical protein GCM10012275_59010 [Longimycelium tulufanense]